MADKTGAATYSVLAATRYAKDNRLLPAGWRPDHPAAADIQPVGTAGDVDFTGGADELEYRIHAPAATGPYTVEAALMFQSITPRFASELLTVDAPAVRDFEYYWRQIEPTPVAVATAEMTLD